MIVIFVVVLVAAVESQYFSAPGFKPDITFNDDNDRFNIKPLIDLQNKYYNALHSTRRNHQDEIPQNNNRRKWIVLEGDEPKSREAAKKIIKHVKKNVDKEIEKIGEILNFAWIRSHKRDKSKTRNNNNEKLEENIDDIVSTRSLDNIFINLGGRRRGNVLESDVRRNALLNYAFPIQMVLRGYLLTPLLVK